MPLSTKLTITACALFLACAPVSAQTAATREGSIATKRRPILHLLDRAGTEHTGRIVTLDEQQVTLIVDGRERRFERAGIVRIEKRGDSLKNGLVIGALAGLAMSLADIMNTGGFCWDSEDCGSWNVLYVALTTGLAAGVGLAVDAGVKGRTVLYQAPDSRQGRASSAGSGAAGTRALGLHLTVRF
jgi:hypothetical protein